MAAEKKSWVDILVGLGGAAILGGVVGGAIGHVTTRIADRVIDYFGGKKRELEKEYVAVLEINGQLRELNAANSRPGYRQAMEALSETMSDIYREEQAIEQASADVQSQARDDDDQFRSDRRPVEAKTAPGAHTAYNGR